MSSNHDAYFGEDMRRALRATLGEMGAPAEFQDRSVDLACHAAKSALEALERIVFSESDGRIQLAAMGLALSLVQARTEGMMQATQKVAEIRGAKADFVDITVRS